MRPVEIRLRILGSLELTGPAGPVRLGAGKERRLLAALALCAGEVLSQERLSAAIWGDHAPRSAQNAVQNYVLRLRRALRSADGVQIVTEPSGYRLVAAPGALDAHVGELLITQARLAAAGGDAAMAARMLGEALALWRGPSLGEFADEPFARAEAARLNELRESAREDLVDAEIALGRHHGLAGELDRMVAAEPLRERRWAQFMLVLYRDGRQAEALDAFRALRRTLTDELGIEPSNTLTELHERVLRHDAILDPAPARGTPAQPTTATGCYGRHAELRKLLGRYDDAAAGRGGVLTVRGEAGIGKTRLLQEFTAQAHRRGALVLSGRCLEGGWIPAHHVFADAIGGYAIDADPDRLRDDLGTIAAPLAQLVPRLRELLIDLPGLEPLAPDEDRMRLLDAVARFLVALSAHGPVVLLLDDLHWADASTLVMLRHVARTALRYRLLMLVAYRDGEAGTELIEAFGALRAESDVTAVHLRGLGADALRSMLGAVVGMPVSAALAGSIRAETKGNPFFAREVIRHLVEEGTLPAAEEDDTGSAGVLRESIPDGVREVLTRRRRRLSHEANRFLDTAAGFDGPFRFVVVAAAGELRDTEALGALDEVIDAGLLEPDAGPDRYQFSHALIRHAIYAALNPSRRLRLHGRLARELQETRAGSPTLVDPAEIATQYRNSAPLPGAEEGVGPALEAADHAQRAAAHDEAATFLAIACELALPHDARVPSLRARLGLALVWALRFDEAVLVARAAADELAATEGTDAAADYLAEVTSALEAADSAPHAWQLAAAGLGYAAARRDTIWASLVLHDLDRRDAADSDFPGMVLDVPERREALRILHTAGGLAGRVDLARFAVAAVYGSRAAIPTAAAEDPSVRLFLVGDYAGALSLFESGASEARTRGRLALEGYCRGSAARCHIALGRLEAGRAGLAEERRIAARIGRGLWGWQRLQLTGTLDAVAHAGDSGWEGVLAHVEQVFGPANPAGRRLEAAAAACAAKAAAHLGRAEVAERFLAKALPALRCAPPWALNHVRTLCDVVETAWLLERRGDLKVLEEVLRDKALPADFRFPMMDIRLALARLCALQGRRVEASHWFATSRMVLKAQGAWPLRAIVDFDEALAQLRGGDAAAAHPLLGAAVAQFERLGMTGWVQRAGELGVRT
jgi:DNA-binding SARP family transcriptional activator